MKNESNFPFELESSWKRILAEELSQPYIQALAAFLSEERASKAAIYPPEKLVFNAFQQTPYNRVNVVIMGQDPYHGPGQAHGLSFSVPEGVPAPPSLKNIFKEIQTDLNLPIPPHGCLLSWAKQGVMLLNATLTVKESAPLSHHGKGWERFTDAVVEKLCEREDPIIFVLWGKSAQQKCKYLIEGETHHYVLTAAHPSPFSAHQGFFGCRHFSKINELLQHQGKKIIHWS